MLNAPRHQFILGLCCLTVVAISSCSSVRRPPVSPVNQSSTPTHYSPQPKHRPKHKRGQGRRQKALAMQENNGGQTQLTSPSSPKMTTHDDTVTLLQPKGYDTLSGTGNVLASNPVHEVSVNLSYVDDIGLVIVENADGHVTLAKKVEWVLGSDGEGQVELNQYLKQGPNLVILVVHNKTITWGPGKWSYDFSLIGDNTVLWRDAKRQVGGNSGIQYWTLFNIEGRTNGLFSVKPASDSQRASIEPEIAQLNQVLIEHQGHEHSLDAAVGVGVLGLGLMAIMGSDDSSAHSYSPPVSDGSFIEQQQRKEQEAEKAAREIRIREQHDRQLTPGAFGY